MSVGLFCCCEEFVYPYEYMNDLEKCNKASLPKNDFNSHLKMEDITDTDYTQSKRVFRDF